MQMKLKKERIILVIMLFVTISTISAKNVYADQLPDDPGQVPSGSQQGEYEKWQQEKEQENRFKFRLNIRNRPNKSNGKEEESVGDEQINTNDYKISKERGKWNCYCS